MKKLLSFAGMLAVLSYASPASAQLNFGGDASVRVRDESFDSSQKAKDDLRYQYRVRLNGSADLGDGYFFKAQITNEQPDPVKLGGGGGWQTVGYGNTEVYTLGVSQLYFGRSLERSHYVAGRLPLNSTNNPIFDLTLYPSQPFDIPATTFNNDRLFGVNYGAKIGEGELNAVVGVFDNNSKNDTRAKGDGLFNDGYIFHLSYKTSLGGVTIEPQFLTALTNQDVFTQSLTAFHSEITPYTFGANVSVPVADDGKVGLSGFYTKVNDTTPNTGGKVDYNGYLLRLKVEKGPFLAWYDYNRTTDKSTVETKYTNQFVWAQYRQKVYQSAVGSFSIQPTVRYLTYKTDGATNTDLRRLRTELWATVTF